MSNAPMSPAASSRPCRVSIIIKAYNEQAHIEAAIESSLRAVSEVGGEVVLADGHSTDRTVELASKYPIRVARLANAGERCCGVGPQLGYQHSLGEYVYLLDGDMQMVPGFLEEALGFLAQHPEVAGVGGRVVEQNLTSLEYRERALRAAPHMSPGDVDRLDGGGLYRRRAIEEAGFLSDRNLHSYEEFDLAVRLRACGWKLGRIPADAVTHDGHDAPPYALLRRRWRTRYVDGLGELVRGAIGRPHMKLVLRDMRELRLYCVVLAWWMVILSIAFWPLTPVARLALAAGVVAAPFVLMAWRKKSWSRAAYSVTSWCFYTAGMVRGFLTPRKNAQAPIPCHIVREPQAQAPADIPRDPIQSLAPEQQYR
ncbi:MAG: glycosyltransferase [Pseudomonadota bacterium]